MLAVTVGEPAGIGPDLLVQLAQAPRAADWVVYGDPDCLLARAHRLKLPLRLATDESRPCRDAGCLTVHPVPLAVPARPGQLDVANAPAVIRMLTEAGRACVEGRARALVTGPVQKSLINEAGIAFSGHTEFFAELAGVDDVVMLLVADRLRVALATTHLPLRAVPDTLTRALLTRRLHILLDDLQRWFGLTSPRVLVAGLNPHAGEGGHLGREEIDVIEPVCAEFRARGCRIIGPLPADTLFTPARLATADAVLAMYHDQGLPVLKHVGFGEAVNVTLGLPFLRTSVDHGTALDLAGTGTADTGSFQAALALAAGLAHG